MSCLYFFFCFFGRRPLLRRLALETPEWTSRDSNHHRQSVSAGKTNAIPTEPSGRLCNVMPVRLLFVISGILAGGIPGFRMELCCFSHPPTWPIGVFCGSSVLLLVLGHSQRHIRCHFACNSHCWWRSHFSVSFLFWFCCGCVFFACCCFVVFGLLSCLFPCWDSFWTAYWSTTSTFVAFDKLTALHVNYNSTVCRD